jgi:hypothetical protein
MEVTMPKPTVTHDRDITTLSLEQRDWIRRQGNLARALEAAQRRSGKRFKRAVPRSERPSVAGRRVSPS